MEINFLFSSITFLQYYMPIVIKGNEQGFKSIFYLRKNCKSYANPYEEDNNKLLKKYVAKYSIALKENIDIKNLKNLKNLIVIDGDIYGPGEKHIKQSLILKENFAKNTKIISICENINFTKSYNSFVNNVSHIILINEIYASEYNCISDKNLYLGNTKYDNILSKSDIYNKYNFDKNKKYFLILLPKNKFIISENIFKKDIIKVINIIEKLGFTVILKTRPKDKVFDFSQKTIISDIYPNESLELMKISQYCLHFSSSCIEETTMMEIPSIDFVVDNSFVRCNFLYDNECNIQYKNWNNITLQVFENLINKLKVKNDNKFKILKNKYLNTENCTDKIFNLLNS
jgi:hypothetical protein